MSAFAQRPLDVLFVNHLLEQRLHEEAIAYLSPHFNDTSITNQYIIKRAAFDMVFRLNDTSTFSQQFLQLAFEKPFPPIKNKLGEELLLMKFIYQLKYKSVYPTNDSIYLAYQPALTDPQLKFANPIIALLRKDEQAFKSFMLICDSSSNKSLYHTLENTSDEIFNQKRKSTLLAGIFSAILPGSGKIYLGKTGQGLASFAGIALLVAQAGEGYFKKGLQSPHLYIFGGIGVLFYIGNIYGTIYSSAVSQHKKDAYYYSILLTNLVQLLS
jgi:TM2 domain-containing membrane protein YozV